MRVLIKTKSIAHKHPETFTIFVNKSEAVDRECDKLIAKGFLIKEVIIKSRKEMIYQRDLAEYGVSTMEQYFDIIIKSSSNNVPMARTMHRDLSRKQKEEFLEYVDTLDMDDIYAADMLIELGAN